MKTWLKIFGALGVFVIAILVSGVVALKSMDFNRFKSSIEAVVENQTGRELTIVGDLDIALSLTPTLSVTDVRFANAAWGQKTPMLTLKRLDAKVALMSIFDGVLDVDYIVLDGLDVVLETDGRGKANWEFVPKEKTSKAAMVSDGTIALNPQVRDVRLRNVHVAYVDGATGLRLETDLKRADFTAEHLDSPLIGDLEASYNGVEVEARAELGSLAQLIGSGGAAFPVNLQISAPGLSAAVIGSVEQPSAGMAVDARVTLSAQDSETLSRLAGAELPAWNKVEVRTDVSGGGTAYTFTDLDAQAGNSDFHGSVDVDLGAKRPRVVAKLSSNVLYAYEIAGVTGGAAETQEKPTHLFSADPLPFALLSTLDADVRYTAKRVSAEPVRLADVQGNVSLQDGKLTLNPVRATIDEGRIVARAVIDAGMNQGGAAQKPTLSVRASVRGLDAGAITALAGLGRIVTLKLDGEVDLKGAGTSVQKIMGGLKGSTNFLGRNGEIHDKMFKDLTEGVGAILPWASSKDANVITCVLAELPIENGEATAQTVLLDTSGVRVNVTGNVDLGGERLHLTVHTKAKKTSLASFAVPVRVKGSFVEPRIDVDPGEAVVGTVGNIVKAPAKLIGGLLSGTISLIESDKEKQQAAAKDDPCLQALGGGKTTPTTETKPEASSSQFGQPGAPSQKSPKDEPADLRKSTGDPKKDLENLGEALEKLF